ncbi:MAG TPA: VanW family protein, partial [Symbiobacteriaceae bacterium]|nr:VanW family protein [Symbiobacteriaceae bacterium]
MRHLGLRALRWWAAVGVVVLVLSVGLVAVAAIEPAFEVRLGQRAVGEGRSLAELTEALEAEADRQMAREVTLAYQGQTWTYRLGELGRMADAHQLQQSLAEAAASLPWWQRLAWSRPVLALEEAAGWDTARLEAALQPIREAIEQQPVPASLAIIKREPVITPEVDGVVLETSAVLEALKTLGDQSTLELPVTQQAPSVTRATLEAMRIKGLVAEWTTWYDPTIPRAENVERAARAFDGLIVKPGEVLSYNGTVGPVDAANGWKEAFVIVNGELVPGVGGGVCQVATTFYGAALRANLDIMERHQHQLAVSYIDPSQDAAIAQGWEDLKIRNTALGHLYIETEAGDGRVTFRLYGEVPEGQEVKIESRVLGSQPFATKKVVDAKLAPGQQVVKTHGNSGLRSEAYRLVYKSGKLVKREHLGTDSYLPTAQVVLVGPEPAPQPA